MKLIPKDTLWLHAEIERLTAERDAAIREIAQIRSQAGDNIELQEAAQRGYARGVAEIERGREMNNADREERRRSLTAKRLADRPRLAAHLMTVVNDASDYENNFVVPLTRSEIYTIWEALIAQSAVLGN